MRKQEIFNKEILLNRKNRNKQIKEAVNGYDYSQKEVADYLGLYCRTMSSIANDK